MIRKKPQDELGIIRKEIEDKLEKHDSVSVESPGTLCFFSAVILMLLFQSGHVKSDKGDQTYGAASMW